MLCLVVSLISKPGTLKACYMSLYPSTDQINYVTPVPFPTHITIGLWNQVKVVCIPPDLNLSSDKTSAPMFNPLLHQSICTNLVKVVCIPRDLSPFFDKISVWARLSHLYRYVYFLTQVLNFKILRDSIVHYVCCFLSVIMFHLLYIHQFCFKNVPSLCEV